MSDSRHMYVELSISADLRCALESGARARHHSLSEEIRLRLEESISLGNSRLHSQAELFKMATDVARMTGGKENSKPIVERQNRRSARK